MTIKEQDDVRLLKPAKEIWHDALQILSKTLKKPTFAMWISKAQLMEFADGQAVLGVNNDMTRVMLSGSEPAIVQALSEVVNESVTLRVVIDPSIKIDTYDATMASITVLPASSEATLFPSSEPTVPTVFAPSSHPNNKHNLNPKYTFETFVVGSHNRFCHSAALAVAERPGETYNPLFLYGGVGLGKTHIMHAIGHQVLKHSPNASVSYISSERFTNELINSIRDNRMLDFRKRYRQVDVLLVDDIQFIQGKDASQEEFFHTFNALRDYGRQIVLCSDRPPKAISLLEERLRSRFEWGLIADIQAPDLETRLAILRKKCEIDGMRVSSDVLEYIASVFTTNIRELEGALIRSHAYASMTGTELTPASLRGILQPVGHERQKKTITIDHLIDIVAAQYRVEASELRSEKRSHDLAVPRHIAMYLAHEKLQMSYPRIGQAFGNRKHTSALYAYSTIKEKMLKDADLSQSIKQISRQLED